MEKPGFLSEKVDTEGPLNEKKPGFWDMR